MVGNKDVKGARRAGEKAISTAEGSRADFLSSPIFLENLKLAMGLQADPLTMGPEVVADLSSSFASELGNKAKGEFAQFMQKIAGTSGTRSGSAIEGVGQLATGTATALAQGLRDIRIAAANKRVEDIARVMAIGQGLQNQQYGFDQNIVNAALGQGQLLAQIAGVPSTLGQIGSGIGSLGGSFLGGEGFARLFDPA